MRRVIIIIGVEKSPSSALSDLQAVATSVQAVENWAKDQKFEEIMVLTDAKPPLRVQTIKDSVKAVVNRGGIDQLVIYFSGHGQVIFNSEFWLLNDVEQDSSEAVSISASVEDARQSRIPHVVFISDACRTAATNLSQQNVRGSSIFPSPKVYGVEDSVDQFFATTLGAPALEVSSGNGHYDAIYTKTMVTALGCKIPECSVYRETGGRKAVFVPPWALKKYLTNEVPKALVARGVFRNQVPDARLASEPEAWLATKDLDECDSAPSPDSVGLAVEKRSDHLIVPGLETGFERIAMGSHALSSKTSREDGVDGILGVSSETIRFLENEADAHATPPWEIFEHRGSIHTGFVVRGDEFRDWTTRERVNHESWAFKEIALMVEKQTNVVLQFATGNGTMLPAIPGYIGMLTVREGQLDDIAYVPSLFWYHYSYPWHDLGRLHGLMSAATRAGVFQPSGLGVPGLRRLVSEMGEGDLSLILFATYAFYNLQESKHARFLQRYMERSHGDAFFDTRMLAEKREGPSESRIAKQTPLLSMGWPLLAARGFELPDSLADLPGTLTPALWSTFSGEGVNMLSSAVKSGQLQ